MVRSIRSATVIGAGVMGATIAAHLANAGLEVRLLDLTDRDAAVPAERSRLAVKARQGLSRIKPSPLFTEHTLESIAVGNLDDDLASAVARSDWVVEAVVERLDVKRSLLDRIGQLWQPGTIVSSNTSGISIERLAEGRSEAFQRHFLGTHFFNPPRYMKLVELIPGRHTDPDTLVTMRLFLKTTLGKRVVQAKDTPNFIANRIGTFGLLASLQEMENHGLSVSAVDALTGPVIGRPKSATFRTLDLVGLDTFAHVARNVYEHATDEQERQVFELPPLLQKLIDEGHLGEKSGSGFYEVRQAAEGKQIYELDPAKRVYIPQTKPRFACIGEARNKKTLAEKLRVMTRGTDEGSRFVWSVLKRTLLYAAHKLPLIADHLAAVDEAMRWGFNWELGPFETWDAMGWRETTDRMVREGGALPDWVEAMRSKESVSFYEKRNGRTYFLLTDGSRNEHKTPKRLLSLSSLRDAGKTVLANAGASLIDLGDEVACLAMHSPNDAVGPDVLGFIEPALDEVRRHYKGLVLAGEGTHYCVGANLMLLLMEAQDDNWPEIERMITQFQRAGLALKYFEKPVVSAPYGMTLGGGVELSIPAARVQAAAETYMGLVETGVGLIPAGGGTKELLTRFTNAVDYDGQVDLQPFVNRAFDLIGMAKVSSGGEDARRLGYLREADRISMNRDFQLYDAKMAVLGLAQAGYMPPVSRPIRVVGTPGLAVLKLALYQLRCGGRISEHDALIGRQLATVLSGGEVPAGTKRTEQQLLDLEREAFLSLCGEAKTQARMQHMLLKGKPLRN